MRYITTINDRQFVIDIEKDGTILVDGEKREVDFQALGPSLYSMITENVSHEVVVEERREDIEVLIRGRMYIGQVKDERSLLMEKRRGQMEETDTGDITIKAPMPGLILKIPVRVGEQVTRGQTLIILESMKMQNELKAPRDGTVSDIQVEAGISVEQHKVLVILS